MDILKKFIRKLRAAGISHAVRRTALATAAVAVIMISSNVVGVYAATTTTHTTKPAPRVTFTFDDGAASAIELAAPTLAKYGYAGVNYVTTECIGMVEVPNTCRADTGTKYMTWDQVRALQNTYGWEIGSHTLSHPLLVSADADDQPAALTPAQRLAEIRDSKIALEAQGLKVESFADPFGDWNMTSLMEIAKYYSSHRPFADVVTATKTNTFPYNDYLPYVVQVQHAEGGLTVAQVKAELDKAKAANQWVVLVFHDITADPTATDDYDYTNSDLDQIAAYVQARQFEVTTMTGAQAGGTNLLAGGNFDTGITGGWTTDNAAVFTADNGNNGSYPGPVNSVAINGAATAAHLYSPFVTVDAAQSYFFKGYLNSLAVGTGGSVTYYVDEYDAAGTWLSGQFKVTEASVWVSNIAFEYKPTNANVKQIRIQVAAAGTGTKAYIDNLRFFSQGGVVAPVLKAGDANGDNLVNIQDATLVSLNWGKTAATRAMGDLNGDGTVNIQDATLISLNWSK